MLCIVLQRFDLEKYCFISETTQLFRKDFYTTTKSKEHDGRHFNLISSKRVLSTQGEEHNSSYLNEYTPFKKYSTHHLC